jgi:DNA repair protein RadC
VAEVELVYKSNVKPSMRPKVTSSDDAYQILIRLWDQDKIELMEQFKVLYLNRANKVLCVYPVSSGGLTGTVADPRLVFGAALRVSATSLILCHNHPSGNLKPSIGDMELTRKIKTAGTYFDIAVFDHLILSSEGYYSFADEGLL